jgi:(p)ppGpp synthase/HD superfamily hydrolase
VKTGKRDRYNIIPIYITLEIPNLSKLNRVLGKIEQIRNVIDAHRQT